MLLAALLALPVPGSAVLAYAAEVAAAGLAPCSARYERVFVWELQAGEKARPLHELERSLMPERLFGLYEHARIIHDQVLGTWSLEVEYPEHSINPGNRSAPSGGLQFFTAAGLRAGAETVCLRYKVRFDPGFAFQRGGKLPGLFGSAGSATTDASGCRKADDTRGFSARLMWRKNGQGEVYAYLPNSASECGTFLGRGNWTFRPGYWHTVELEIMLNRPGAQDGVLRVWVDESLRLREESLLYRNSAQILARGVFFSTFFGGKTAAWASPRTQAVRFAELEVFAAAAKAGPHGAP